MMNHFAQPTVSSQSLGRFIVFEGLDGSGKSTLIQAVADHLRQEQGLSCLLTREPGGTPLGEDLRHQLLRTDREPPVPKAELLIYAAIRAQHVARVIRPEIEMGHWVLCDRFSASTVAFQCFARGLPREEVDWLNRLAQQGLQPSLTVLLDLDLEESHRRRTGRQVRRGQRPDRMENESREFHQRVRQGYLDQANQSSDQWLVLDATQSPKELLALLMKELEVRGWLKF